MDKLTLAGISNAGSARKVFMSGELKTLIVSASHRPGAESLRVANAMNEHYLDGAASILDLYETALPIWDGATAASESVEKAASLATEADALIFVIPEWHGMVPAGLKNLLLWLGAGHLAHKPVLLVGVSASVGGAFVIAEMRSSGYKNSRLVFTPEHLILRGVGDLWQDGEGSESVRYLSERSRFAIDQLLIYAGALKSVRGQLEEGMSDYANGMS
ncbi:MAG: NADPH-dependent FMN reductase [Oceanobacter sp.]